MHPTAQGGAADLELLAQLRSGYPQGCLLDHQLILPRASSQRCRCQSRCERELVGFLATRCRPSLSRPERRMANRVERLIARWEQSSAVVSQRCSLIGSQADDAATGLGREGGYWR